MSDITETFKKLGPTRLAAMGVVTVGLIAFFIFLITRISTPSLGVLYTGLSAQDATAIASKLEGMNVPYKLSPDNTKISVPHDEIGKIRMSMAQDGLPSGGSVGYEIFDKQDSFNATNFVQNINQLRALEGELGRTISTLAPIKSARVHLVLPKRELFSRDKNSASASIFLKTNTSGKLNREQISAIQHLVAAAVPNLNTKNISIIDSKGNLLARGGDVNHGVDFADAKEQTIAFEERLRNNIENLLSRSLGYGKVRAEVSADLDFDHVTTSSEKYDPDGQVIRSSLTSEDQSESTSENTNKGVSVSNNLPNNQAASGEGSVNSDKSSHTEETLNYEINKTITSRIKETGNINRVSVAVLVDGTYKPNDEGIMTYTARTEDELKKIEALVTTSAGLDMERGDNIEVINMQFADLNDEFAPSSEGLIMGLPQPEFIRIIELSVLAIVSLLVILLVIRPIVMKVLATTEKTSSSRALTTDATPQIANANNASAAVDALESADTNAALLEHDPDSRRTPEEIEQMISLNQVEGKVRASSVKKVGDIVDKHIEETVSLVRSWLYQDN